MITLQKLRTDGKVDKDQSLDAAVGIGSENIIG